MEIKKCRYKIIKSARERSHNAYVKERQRIKDLIDKDMKPILIEMENDFETIKKSK